MGISPFRQVFLGLGICFFTASIPALLVGLWLWAVLQVAAWLLMALGLLFTVYRPLWSLAPWMRDEPGMNRTT
jgi:hypothetical protein